MSENIQETREAPKAKPEVRINGQLYKLRFDLDALEQIEQEFGGTREAFAAMKSGSMGKAVRKLFRITANCRRDYDGLPMDVTEETIGKHTSLAKIAEISAAIQAAVEAGMKSETNGGEADDEPQDALAEEYDAKNA